MPYPALRDKRSVQGVAKVEEVCCSHTECLQCIRHRASRPEDRPAQRSGRPGITVGMQSPPLWCSDYKYTLVAVKDGVPVAADQAGIGGEPVCTRSCLAGPSQHRGTLPKSAVTAGRGRGWWLGSSCGSLRIPVVAVSPPVRKAPHSNPSHYHRCSAWCIGVLCGHA